MQQLFAALALLVLAPTILLGALADSGVPEQAAERRGTLLSPVVTLMIGGYFRSEERSNRPGG